MLAFCAGAPRVQDGAVAVCVDADMKDVDGVSLLTVLSR